MLTLNEQVLFYIKQNYSPIKFISKLILALWECFKVHLNNTNNSKGCDNLSNNIRQLLESLSTW